MHALSIEAAAQSSPHRIALIVDGGATYTFAELAARVRATAGALRERMRTSPCVAIVADFRPQVVFALLACWEHGWTPILVHPRLTSDERSRVLAGFEIDVSADAVPDDLDAVAASEPVASAGDDATTAAIVFTSGTAGAAKGVVLPRSAFVAMARASAANLGWRDDDRWLASIPLAHVGGLCVLARTLVARRTAVLPRVQAPADAFPELVERHRITIASLVPTILHRLLAAGWGGSESVRALLVGGAASSPALLAEAAARRLPVLTTYGMTEACSQVATQTYGMAPAFEQGCGPPLLGVRVRIVDDEIQVAGPTLMTGYARPGGPPERPFVDGWFPTGDLGRFDAEGRLHIQGRRKELLITGGENVHPLEVEQVLESSPDVAAACVFAVPDERWGELVVAALVARDATTPDDELYRRVSEHARQRLATYKRPRQFARLAALVMTGGGKLDRRATAERARGALVPAPRHTA